MDATALRQILRDCHTIAVVGLSPRVDRPSHEVARYLKGHGYRIVPVNPTCSDILGETSYPDLASIPFAVDMVDVFRKPQDCPSIAREAVAIGAKVLWLQLGVVSDEAARIASTAGLRVVMDRCTKIEHARLGARACSCGNASG